MSTIKPRDLVRTPSGRTVICVGLNGDGSRELWDPVTDEYFSMMPQHLFLVHSAKPQRWPAHVLT